MEVRHKRLRRRKLVDLNELFTSKGSNKVHQNFGATTRPQYPRFNRTPLHLFSIIAESYIEILRCQLHYTYFDIWYIFSFLSALCIHDAFNTFCLSLFISSLGLCQVAIPRGRTAFVISTLMFSFGGGRRRVLVTTHDGEGLIIWLGWREKVCVVVSSGLE